MITIPMTLSVDQPTVPMGVSTDAPEIPMQMAVRLASGTKELTYNQNGVYTEDVADYAEAKVTVNVPTYEQQEKTATPSEQSQIILPDEGKLLSKVTVEPIPSRYKDITIVTALPADVRQGKVFVGADGQQKNGSFIYHWEGDELELLNDNVYSVEKTLKSTSFNGWTPSTTAKTIFSAQNAAETLAADMLNYDYILKWYFRFLAAYQSGATLKLQTNKQEIVLWQQITRRSGSLADINAGRQLSNVCLAHITAPLIFYYNSSGALTYSYTGSYGIYCAATAATFSNSTSDTPTVTIKSPAVSARCSNTYMSTARAAELDQDNSKFTLTGKLYRVKHGSDMFSAYKELVDYHVAGL